MPFARRLCVLLVAVAPLVVSACGSGEQAREGSSSSAPSTATHGPAGSAVAWTHATVLRRVDGRRLRVAGRTVGIDASTVTCVGVGRATARSDAQPAWSRFRCVQPTFPPGAVVGPDLIFLVEPTGPSGFVVRDPHFTRY